MGDKIFNSEEQEKVLKDLHNNRKHGYNIQSCKVDNKTSFVDSEPSDELLMCQDVVYTIRLRRMIPLSNDDMNKISKYKSDKFIKKALSEGRYIT